MNEQEKAEQGFELNESIKKRELARRKLFGLNVIDLVRMYDDDLYQSVLGKGVEPKWSAYLSQIEVYYSRWQVERWRRFYNLYIKKLGLEIDSFIDIPESRLQALLPLVKTVEEAEEWFGKARILTAQDFSIEVREAKGLPLPDDCKHQHEVYRICKRCGDKIKQDVQL